MRLSLTLVLILSIITHGYSDPKKPKKPKGCTTYSCSDWDWKNKKGLFDPHTIKWPLHYTGEILKDKIDGGTQHIDVVFNHYGKKERVALKNYRNSTYHPDPWFLDKGLAMNDPLSCEELWIDEPTWKDNSCAMVASSFEDVQVNFDGSSCSKIVRNWYVVDWCKWEPNSVTNTRTEKYALVKDLSSHSVYFSYGKDPHDIEHDGWYSFQQVIKILDHYPPDIAYCHDLEYDLDGSCEAKIKLKNKAVDSGPCPGEKMQVEVKVYRTDGSSVLTKWIHAKNQEEFWVNLGYLPGGDYLVHWLVTDGCGNSGGCTQKLTIVDKNPPHLICIQDLSTAINDSDGATIWAKDFVHKATGPCYDNNLTYSFEKDSVVSSMNFSCPDGPGIHEMEIFVTASNGVWSSCNVTLMVADHNECEPNSMQISGKVTDQFMRAVPDAEVMVKAQQNLISSGMTNHHGIYGAQGITFDLSRPEIEATVHDESKKGLDAADLIYVLRHAQNIEQLDKTTQRAAADVNSDGAIDMEDYWDLTDVIYDLPHRETQIKQSWKFFDEKVRFANISNHTKLVQPVKLARYRMRYDLIALKTGDVNFSWTPDDVAYGRSIHKSQATVSTSNGLTGYEVNVPSGNPVQSISLEGSGLDSESIKGVKFNGVELSYVIDDLDNKHSLIILSQKDLSGGQIVISSTTDLQLTGKGLLFETIDDKAITSDWVVELLDVAQDGLMAISPNPFDEFFTIDLAVDSNQSATLEIVASDGRLIEKRIHQLVSGKNRLRVDLDKGQSGLYVVIVSTDTERYIQRIIKQ